MRILFVTPMFPSARNIQQGIFVWELACALQRMGHDVRVASVEPVIVWPFRRLGRYRRQVAQSAVPHFEPLLRMEVPLLPRNTGMRLMLSHWGRRLGRLVETQWSEWRPEIIHAHALFPGAMIAHVLTRRWRIPQVVTSHGSDTRVQIHRRGPRRDTMALLRGGVQVVGVGDWIVRTLKDLGGDAARVTRIYNGIDLSKLSPAPDALRRQYEGRKVVLGMGNLLKTKGFDLLLQAFANLVDEFPSWDLVIVGGGRESSALLRLREKLGLRKRVTFTGPLDRTEAMHWMDLCDVFCLPSWSEGFGIVYLEAMANGKPVIAVKDQGIDPVVREYQSGLLVEPKDVTSLTDALRTLMGDPQLRTCLGERGFEIARSLFTWDRVAQQYTAVYEGSIERSRDDAPRATE